MPKSEYYRLKCVSSWYDAQYSYKSEVYQFDGIEAQKIYTGSVFLNEGGGGPGTSAEIFQDEI